MSSEALEYITVKNKIEKAEKFSDFLEMETEESIINSLLDSINRTTKDINRLTDLLKELDDILLQSFNKLEITHKKDLLEKLEGLSKKGYEMYRMLYSSSPEFKSGIKSALRAYNESLGMIVETIQDFRTSIFLSEDKDYNSIVNTIVE